MSLKLSHLMTAQIPQARRVVVHDATARCDDEGPVWAEYCVLDHTVVALQLGHRLSAEIPHASGVVRARGDDEPAVRAEGRIGDETAMPFQINYDLPRKIPHARGRVPARGDDE